VAVRRIDTIIWPLLLLALDRRLGESGMQQVVRYVLNENSSVSRDYALLRQAALRAGLSETEWRAFETDCVSVPPIDSCLSALADAK